jgi:hypothetical protein
VNNEFRFPQDMRLFLVSRLGYCIVMIDSRGSAHRGVHFEKHLKDYFGSVELRDQVKGLQFLSSTPGQSHLSVGDHEYDLQFVDIHSIAETHGGNATDVSPPAILRGIVDLSRVAISGWSYGEFCLG